MGTPGGVLLLSPSRGLGGGIERYVETLEWAFASCGVSCERIDLTQSGPAGHARLLAQSAVRSWSVPSPARLVVAHRALLPAAVLLARCRAIDGISVICHGSDVWGPRLRPRWFAETRLMRQHSVRVVAVSSFTAGALPPGVRASVLPPGLSARWFADLARAGAAAAARSAAPRSAAPVVTPRAIADSPRTALAEVPPWDRKVRLITAFRLADWRDKGLPELIAAVDSLGRPDVVLSVCGSGQPPADLLRAIQPYPWCTLRTGLSDAGLAAELAGADLFVLATRTRPGRPGQIASGEGFGLVLLEAQVAGTPVAGPAHGGSHDAYLEGVTGATPTGESAAELADLLGRLLKDPAELGRMGARAAAWASESFAPERYAELAVARLL